jgi:hypothetical protein
MLLVPVGILVGILAPWGSQALAIQSHGGGEGLYVHQGAHLFFIVSMASVAWRIRRSALKEQRAWRLMSTAAWLMVAWNIWAFTGHALETFVPGEHLVRVPGTDTPALLVETVRDVCYYVLRMDHLLAVPAVLYFYLALRAMLRDFDRVFPQGQDH